MSTNNNNNQGDEDIVSLSDSLITGVAKEIESIKRKREDLREEREQLEKEKREWEQATQKFGRSVPSNGKIKLDVGGTMFATSVETLTTYKGSFFDVMFSGRFPLKKEEDGPFSLIEMASILGIY
eukprot:TRINITY_DN7522_c0_g1_i1.p1 TRINITY_DN7522_c0_g1~~TRINITY_DN7522_c0_g1_i1.p1  ORF type:complete len:125 (-),score=43.61 TRINITY_DN7522_c0_g1_i1:267-641(-)